MFLSVIKCKRYVIENQPRLGVENGCYREFPRESGEIEKDAEKVKEYSKREWKKIFKEKTDKYGKNIKGKEARKI